MEGNAGGWQAGTPEENTSFDGSIRDFPGALWSLALSPGRFLRNVPDSGGYGRALLFATLSALALPLIVGLIAAIVGIPVALIWAASSQGGSLPGVGIGIGIGFLIALGVIILTPISLVIGLLILTCVQHLSVLLFAGSERRGFGETFKMLAYALSPGYFVSSLPVVNFFAWIWQLALAIVGVREVHRTSWGRAALAVIAPALVVGLISAVIAVAAFFFINLQSNDSPLTGGGGPGSFGGSPTTQEPRSAPPGSSQGKSGGGKSVASQSTSTPSGSAPSYATKLPDPSTSTSPGISAQNIGFTRDDYRLTFYGEILNESKKDVVAPNITVRLYNDRDKIVGTLDSSGPTPSVIGADQRGVWDATASGNDIPKTWSRTKIEVVEDKSVSEVYSQIFYPDLKASGVRLVPGSAYTSPTMTATVSNTGEQTPGTVLASGAIYDKRGVLLDVVPMSQDDFNTKIGPGDSQKFKGYVDNPDIDAKKSYDVSVYLNGTKDVN